MQEALAQFTLTKRAVMVGDHSTYGSTKAIGSECRPEESIESTGSVPWFIRLETLIVDFVAIFGYAIESRLIA